MPAPDPGSGPPRGGLRDPLALVALAAVVIGVLLRFVGGSSLWLDEALSVNIASLAPAEMLDALRRDGHPPLYYLLLHAWMQVVGEGDVAVRALSGIFSLLALPLAYLVALRRGGRPTALAAVALLAMSPYALHYAGETRMYSLVMLEVLAGWLLLDDLRAGRPGRWRGPALAIVAAALVLTHYWGLFLVGSVVLCLLSSVVLDRRAGSRTGGQSVAALDDAGVDRSTRPGAAPGGRGHRDLQVAGWVLLGAAGFAVWLPSFLDQLGSTGTPWAPPVRPSAALGVTLQDLMGRQVLEGVVGAALLGALVLLALTARPRSEAGADRLGPAAHPTEAGTEVVIDLRTVAGMRDVALVAALTLVGGATVSWVGGSTFASRYASVVAPLVVVVMAYGAVRVPARAWQACIVALACTFGLVGTLRDLTYPRTQMGEVAAAVAERAAPDDLVLYCPDQLGPAGSRLLPDGLDQVVYPTLAPPQFVDWVDYADRMAASDPVAVAAAVDERAAGRSVFVVANPGYRTVEGRCDDVRDALRELRGPGDELVALDSEGNWESARLTWFPAP